MSGVLPGGYKKGRRDLQVENPKVTQNIHTAPRAYGWDLPFGSPERMEFIKERRYAEANTFIESEMAKPEEERFMPPQQRFNPLSLDLLSTGLYAHGALAQKALYGDSITETFMNVTTPKEVQIRAEADILRSYQFKDPELQKRALEAHEYSKSGMSRFSSDLTADPFNLLTAVNTGVSIYINAKKVQLTEDGAKMLRAMYLSAPTKNSAIL